MVDVKGEQGEGETLAGEHDPAADARWDGAPLETRELQFDDNVRLPWLEADGEDEDEFEARGSGQLVALVVMGLLGLAVIGGGIWWALDSRKDEVLVADGSTLPAPAPYKEEPKDPGGKTFAGTGDTSFAVAKGQTRPVQIDDRASPTVEVPKPSAGGATAPASQAAAQTPPAPSGPGVQVAAYSSRASAEAGWTRLSGQYELLSGLSHRIVEGNADIGTVYRLQIVTGDMAGAQALCAKLKGVGLACQVKN